VRVDEGADDLDGKRPGERVVEAQAEAVRQEADSKPGLTLEEAIRVQMRRNAATLVESRHLEAR
jgi:hypothetical protein